MQVTKAMGRIVENVTDRLPKDSALAAGLSRVWSKGEKPFFQLITENEDTPKQVLALSLCQSVLCISRRFRTACIVLE